MGKITSVKETIEAIDYRSFCKKLTIDYRDEVYEKMSEKNQLKSDYANRLAEKLVKTYSAPDSINYFRKCAWNLTEDDIWTAVEKSKRKRVRDPLHFFIWETQRLMR